MKWNLSPLIYWSRTQSCVIACHLKYTLSILFSPQTWQYTKWQMVGSEDDSDLTIHVKCTHTNKLHRRSKRVSESGHADRTVSPDQVFLKHREACANVQLYACLRVCVFSVNNLITYNLQTQSSSTVTAEHRSTSKIKAHWQLLIMPPIRHTHTHKRLECEYQ